MCFITQMDTFYNNEATGSFLQTVKFINAEVLFAVLRDSKTTLSKKNGVVFLESVLEPEIFHRYVHILLTI